MKTKTLLGVPHLSVTYSDNEYTLVYEYMGGDAIETLAKTFDGDAPAIEWLRSNLRAVPFTRIADTLPFADQLGQYRAVPLTEIEIDTNDTGKVLAQAVVWESFYDRQLESEARVIRRTA